MCLVEDENETFQFFKLWASYDEELFMGVLPNKHSQYELPIIQGYLVLQEI